jgi:hypothetical protein
MATDLNRINGPRHFGITIWYNKNWHLNNFGIKMAIAYIATVSMATHFLPSQFNAKNWHPNGHCLCCNPIHGFAVFTLVDMWKGE